ncbi:ubiquinone/menaquinone biosynthesis C-methylase UbiE [Gillisia sp. Hel_I_86]|uniref:class I SAM-dependent methyltransferase n=1 Tax=Gillisia sp. Hel_I_86 TaxID=1249981 RepID=UPI00119A765A|nr:class I SAM-dependent methyltransferase [Gillisia sp. Hel_I_86]TVZ28655.1 ubiquinone/menaquinone biosynthesis C-methylase UbiE [Gillisia sp. Hel_I_86]
MTKPDQIKNRYNRVARCYDWMESPMETAKFSKWRRELTRQVTGNTLEVGIGTGKNIPYYPEEVKLTAIDFSKNMLKRAKLKYQDDPRKISFIEMDAQDMIFEDNTFDTVVTSCVFCSVPDPVKGLQEIRRVLKPGGQLLMLEHVRSKQKFLGRLMDWFNFVPLNIWGANINRQTIDNLKKAGFTKMEVNNLWRDIVKLIKVRNIK